MNELWLKELRQLSVEELLLPVLIQLVVILITARVFGSLFHRLRQPVVVGEIAAGLVLGPSVLGALFPSIAQAVFHPSVGSLPHEVVDILFNKIFTILSQLGLIFLLFLVGLEFDFSHLRWHGKAALGISVSGVALPFALGLGVAWLLWPHVEAHPERPGQAVPMLGFMLFMGVAMSITAIPVLGRMMMELNITRSRLGAITISAAAVDDATGWILLAAVAAVARGELAGAASGFAPATTLLMAAVTVAFVLAMVFLVRPLLRWGLGRLRQRGKEGMGLNILAVLLALVFLSSIATNLIGIFAVFGAFLMGAILSGEEKFKEAVISRLRDVVTVFFLPIYFTYTGLRTNVGALTSPQLWFFCALVLLAAIAGKLGGCGLAARLGGFSVRESCCVGVLMNTRGLMELVVINAGYELGVIPPSVFCMLVIMAMVTTVMTTPVLLRMMPGTELEPYIRRSEFFGAPQAEDSEPARQTVPETPEKTSEPKVESDVRE
jgi:Kef-type K+ transport system membrane component KefB